jgi:hypothetical protein
MRGVGGFAGRFPRRQGPTRVRSLDGFRPGKPLNGYAATVWSPGVGYENDDATPDVKFLPWVWDGLSAQYEVEFATDDHFLTVVATASGTCTHEVLQTVTAPTLPRRTIYWRVRVGRSPDWGYWASSWFVVTQNTLSVAAYMDVNVGVVTTPPQSVATYMDVNVGVVESPVNTASYMDLNVGPLFTRLRFGLGYMDVNVHPVLVSQAGVAYHDVNVTSDTPTPHIWWIRPAWGKTGWVFHVFGHGFGSFQNEYNGDVELGGVQMAVLEWELVPPSGAPQIVQGPTEDDEVATVEHGHIVVVVPAGLSIGEHPVRVVLA